MPIKLNKIINSFTPSDKYQLTNWTDRIDVARPKLFDFDYTLTNHIVGVNNKQEFERLFLKKYYNREIGASGGTVTAFKHDLEVLLMEEIPYFNQLLETLSWDYDPLINFKSEEELIRKVTDSGTDTETIGSTFDQDRTTNTDSTSGLDSELTRQVDEGEQTADKAVEFIVPQGMTNIDDMNFQHATSANQQKGTTDRESTETSNRNDTTTGSIDSTDTTLGSSDSNRLLDKENVKDETMSKVLTGLRGKSNQQLVAEYRRNILNVITELVDRCDVLFYQIYDY